MPSSSRDSRDTWAQPAIPWRTSQRSTANNTSNGCSSATTSSGGLYRNLPKGAPANFPQSKKDPSEPLGKRVWDHEEKQAEPVIARRNKLVERSREYLPCYVKPRRSVIETDEELEVRSDAINRRQVWVRPIGSPSLTLREALEKAELVPLPRLRKAYPILVLTRDDQRKRGLIISEDGNSVEYLDVDTGRVEEASAELVFKPDATLLSIPNAAIRCRLDTKDEELDSKLQSHKANLSQWTRTRVHVMRWGCIPTVYLSIIEPNFDLKPVVERQRSEPERKIQKLYRTLPGIVIPPPFTILRNCSVLHVEEDNAFIVQNDAPFETDPSESTGNNQSSPSLREQEQLYLEGDIVRAQYNELEMRVMIREVTGSAVVVRSVDSGATYEVGDFRELKPLLKREPSRAMRVTLPREYLKLSREELPVLLKTGVFDVFFESSESTPRVRLFTQRGQEIHVCLAKKTDPVIRADDSEDERSSTRSCRG